MKGIEFIPSSKSEFWKMLRSEVLQKALNKTALWNIPKRNWLLRKLFGSIDGNTYLVQSPLHVCYGCNIHVGKNFVANYNCVIMDHAPVIIGDNVFLAPNVSLITVNHSVNPDERRVFRAEDTFHPEKKGNCEIIAPITIGDDVWIGAGTTVLPGVTIGSGTTIGAGSVVTRDVPPNVIAYGVPCKVVESVCIKQYAMKRGVEMWEKRRLVKKRNNS